MPECHSCQTPHAPEDDYCGQCGANLTAVEYMESGARTQKSLDLVDVYYNLGLVYFKKEQFQEALETWQKGMNRDPGNEALQERIEEAKARLES